MPLSSMQKDRSKSSDRHQSPDNTHLCILRKNCPRAKPETPGFFIPGIMTAVQETETEKVKIWLYISVFAMITGLLVVGAMLFPGITLNNYLDEQVNTRSFSCLFF
mgnify:CR=1 FL=1